MDKNVLGHFDFFILRTPLVPISSLTLAELGEALERPDAFEKLKTFFDVPLHRAALSIASHSLVERLNDHKEAIDQKLAVALYRYLSRAATRCTPYGLFAGVTVGKIGTHTTLALQSTQNYRQHSKIDFARLTNVLRDIQSSETSLRHGEWRINSSLAHVGNDWRYIERRGSGPTSTEILSTITDSEAIRALVSLRNASFSVARVKEILRSTLDSQLDDDTIESFFADLVREQVVESVVMPPVTGKEPIDHAIEVVQSNEHLREEFLGSLVDLKNEATSATGLVEHICSQTAPMPTDLHVDLHKPADDCVISEALVSKISHLASLVRPYGVREDPKLEEFKKRIVERYNSNWIPLMEAIDDELGVAFLPGAVDLPLLRGIPFASDQPPPDSSPTMLGALLARKAEHAWRNGQIEVELTDDEIAKCQPRSTAKPALSFYGWFSVLSKDLSPDFRLNGADLYLRGIGGTSATELLSRFAHGEPELSRHLTRIAAAEQNNTPNSILAEVCFGVDQRHGNIALRPHFRDYEIPYLSGSSQDRARQIPVDDILLSVQFNEIQLKSVRLGSFIRPVMSNAHNYLTSRVALYRFLGHLQKERVSNFSIDWPTLLQHSRFLPRVRAGSVILVPARWTLNPSWERSLDAAESSSVIAALRSQLQNQTTWLPRWVTVADGDQKQVIDLQAPIGLRMLENELRRRPGLVVEEALSLASGCVTGPEGRFANEIILPLNWRSDPTVAGSSTLPSKAVSEITSFSDSRPPGSEWVYFKIYCGLLAGDSVIAFLSTMSDQLLKSGVIHTWHFIRYSDPLPHVRARFCRNPDQPYGEVVDEILETLQPALKSQLVWRIQLDTYTREVDRYGGEAALPLFEKAFAADSECVAGALQVLSASNDTSTRGHFAIMSAHRLFDDFSYPLETRIYLLRLTVRGLQAEFDNPGAREAAISKKFRDEKIHVLPWVTGEGNSDIASDLNRLVEKRSICIRDVAMQLRALESDAKLSTSLASTLMSLIHMALNRIFVAQPREQELIVYDYLRRVYDSLCRKQAPTSSPGPAPTR